MNFDAFKMLEALPWIRFWQKNANIALSATVDRFVFERRPKKAHPGFFMGKNSGDDISVFETSHMKEIEIWSLGRKIQSRSVKARCSLKVADIKCLEDDEESIKFNLYVKRSPETATSQKLSFFDKWWHANISKCPESEERYKLMALSLCEVAHYKRNPEL